MTICAELLPQTPVDEGQLVLVIDDDPGVRRTLTSLLRENGIAVISAADGQDGLDTVRSVRRTRRSHEIIVPWSAAEDQEVKNCRVDEVFGEHGIARTLPDQGGYPASPGYVDRGGLES